MRTKFNGCIVFCASLESVIANGGSVRLSDCLPIRRHTRARLNSSTYRNAFAPHDRARFGATENAGVENTGVSPMESQPENKLRQW